MLKRFLPQGLIIAGIIYFLCAGFLLWQKYATNQLFFTHQPAPHNSTLKLKPVEIVIKDVRIDVPIFESHITNNTWETTTEGASYLVSSPIPGEIGNSIIYGHDWTSIFGPLVNAKPGEKIQIKYNNGTKQIFTIQYTQVVSPDNTSVLGDSSKKQLTMYTCTDFLDSKRFVVVAQEK